VSGVRISGPWLPLDEANVRRVGGHMGVYELAADGEVVRIGFAGGRSVFGLRGELERTLRDEAGAGAAMSFRYEITTSYLSRYRELLMVYASDHGAIPAGNADTEPELGRLSPG
jgi:hypothetical protein